MDKENLKVKVEALRANEVIASEALDTAKTKRMRAEVELQNADKPVISESLAADLVEQIAEMFSDVVSNADVGDMSPEFGLSYNEITLECLDMSNIGISDHDIQVMLEDFFAIKIDEDEDLESISSTGREGRE